MPLLGEYILYLIVGLTVIIILTTINRKVFILWG